MSNPRTTHQRLALTCTILAAIILTGTVITGNSLAIIAAAISTGLAGLATALTYWKDTP